MQVALKIKIKSLAAEAGIIRHEERKLIRPRVRTLGEYTPLSTRDGDIVPVTRRVKEGAIPWAREHQKHDEVGELDYRYNSLRHHRTILLRREARASQLAYAFLRGKHYAKTEHKDSVIDAATVATAARLIGKYGLGNLAVEVTSSIEQRVKLLRKWIAYDPDEIVF